MSKKKQTKKKATSTGNHSKGKAQSASETIEVAPDVGQATESSAGADARAADVARADVSQAGGGKPRKKSKSTKRVTLGEVAAGYLAELELRAASAATLFSYELELQAALEELGKDRLAAEIGAEEVGAFFGSARVTRKKSGGEKSPLSIAKTCRVLRQALGWAVQQGLLEKAPLPEPATAI